MKNSMLVICGIIVVLFASQATAAIINNSVTYNLTELPKTGTFTNNVTLFIGANVNFSVDKINNHTTMTFPQSLLIYTLDNTTQFQMNYTIPFFADITGNQTTLLNIINVTNDQNNNTAQIYYYFNILHPSITNLSNNNSGFVILSGGLDLQINTYTIIDFNITHNVILQAPPNATINITCGQFVLCASNVTLGTTNQTNISTRIYVPKNTTAGSYDTFLTFQGENLSQTIRIHIVNEYRSNIYDAINYNAFEAHCFDSPQELAQCYKNQAQYNAEVANALLAQLAVCNASQEQTKLINETIKYVQLGDLNKETYDQYLSLLQNYNTLTMDYRKTATNYQDCVDKSAAITKEANDREFILGNDYLLKKNTLENETTTAKEEARQKSLDLIRTFFLAVAIILFVTIVIGEWCVGKWIVSSFPTKILGAIMLAAIIGYLVTKFIIN